MGRTDTPVDEAGEAPDTREPLLGEHDPQETDAAWSRRRHPAEEVQNIGASCVVAHRVRLLAGSEEVSARWQTVLVVAQDRVNPAPQSIAFDRATSAASDRERHAGVRECVVGGVQHPQNSATDASTAAQRHEISALAAPLNQALRR